MRSLYIAVTLLLSSITQAAPTFQFFTEHSQLHTGQGAAVFIGNSSEETAHDVVVQLEWSEGLRLHDGIHHNIPEWKCTLSQQTATCTLATLAPNDFDGLFFTFVSADGAPGHKSATATLSARDVGTVASVAFDIIVAHSATITSGLDFGQGSLRAAIEEINANPLCGTDVPCTIQLGGGGFDPFTIAPTTPLPPIRKCNVWISGPDDPEFPYFAKRVAISGENATHGNGLEIRATCASGIFPVRISSLAIHSWPWNGIHFAAPEAHGAVSYPHQVNRVYVGTDMAGLVAKPNRSRGINVDSPHEKVLIGSSIVSGNGRSGISLWRGKHAYVVGTKIGVDRLGNALGNGASGFFSKGVPFQLVDNTIAHNAHFGVSLTLPDGEAQITHNAIHSNAGLPIDWNLDGRNQPDDESDGALNAPQILDAIYNDASDTVTIRGVVRLRAGAFGGSFGIYLYRAISTRGDVIQMYPIPPQAVAAPQEGTEDVPFEFTIAGIPRGTLVAAQTVAGTASPEISSEISEAVAVR